GGKGRIVHFVEDLSVEDVHLRFAIVANLGPVLSVEKLGAIRPVVVVAGIEAEANQATGDGAVDVTGRPRGERGAGPDTGHRGQFAEGCRCRVAHALCRTAHAGAVRRARAAGRNPLARAGDCGDGAGEGGD